MKRKVLKISLPWTYCLSSLFEGSIAYESKLEFTTPTKLVFTFRNSCF